jgi:cytochrome c553
MYALLLSWGSVRSYADMTDTESLQPWETCALCHGFDGNSTMAKFPKLAGQKPAYLRKQIRDFALGWRDNDGGQMVNMVADLNSSDIDQIADWFASQSPPQPVSADLSVSGLKAARKLFYQGSAERPACNSCHHPDNAQIPYIRSQHAGYLKKQLNDFKTKARTNDSGHMHAIANTLSVQQIEWLASYVASLDRRFP